jgi:YXWGXW repeat-containing protein
MKLRSLLLAGFVFLALPLASFAQVGISVNFAPPPLIVEAQPPAPVAGYIWTPGYWGWGGAAYYWVPGVWVAPPAVGLLWTPGWWGWNNGLYGFNEGYWGPTVGFYGGINYGYGYFGSGYSGGRWEGDTFRYNTAVTHVNTTVIHNTYVDSSVNKQVNASHASFNGPNGVKAEATAEQKAAAQNAKKMPPTSEQVARQEAASKDPKLQASANKGHPSSDAIKSFNQTHKEGKGVEGVGAAATGAGAGKTENKPGTVSEHSIGAGAEKGAEHANKHATENLHGQQNLGGTHGKAHTGKPPGYAASAHGQHPPMGAYHPQAGGNRAHATGQQQQGKKKQGKPEQPH